MRRYAPGTFLPPHVEEEMYAEKKNKEKKKSLMRRRREAVIITLPHAQFFFNHLSSKTGNFKWKYLIFIRQMDDVRWRDDNSPYNKFIEHDESATEVKMLREFGIGKIYFCRPWFAVTEDNSLVIIQMMFGERIMIIYNIYSDKIILDRRLLVTG